MEKEASVGKEYSTEPSRPTNWKRLERYLRKITGARLGPPETVLCKGTI